MESVGPEEVHRKCEGKVEKRGEAGRKGRSGFDQNTFTCIKFSNNKDY